MAVNFDGFNAKTFSFLTDLAANNSKDWFDANRSRYEDCWKNPALDLINAFLEPMAMFDPPLKAEARINGSLRRINRDVRFSKDKSPYNARLHIIFWAGAHPNRSPGFHLVLEPTGIGYGAGVFGLDTNALATYRQRILDPTDRATLLNAIKSAERTGSSFGEPELKNLPRRFEASGDWEHLLRRKSFVCRTFGTPTKPDWLHSHEFTENVMGIARAHMPLIKWLSQ